MLTFEHWKAIELNPSKCNVYVYKTFKKLYREKNVFD